MYLGGTLHSTHAPFSCQRSLARFDKIKCKTHYEMLIASCCLWIVVAVVIGAAFVVLQNILISIK